MRINDKDLRNNELLARDLGVDVKVYPAAYGATVKANGVETYYRTKREAWEAITRLIMEAMG